VEKIMKAPGIKIKNLMVGFSEHLPINQTKWELDINPGELVGIIGPNGSGKTSFLRALMGDETFLSGEILIGGESESVQSWSSKKISQHFSYLPQESFFDSFQETEAYLRLAFLPRLGLLGRMSQENSAQLDSFARDFELSSYLKKRLQDLSSGERQRVFLGRVLLQPSQMVLLDEPTNHLDPNVVEKTWLFLKNQKNKKTVLVATHDLSQVERHCDRVIVLSGREMLFSGTVSEYQTREIKRLVFPFTY
jgi:iron complex transport system ATP-binding protein